MKFLFVRKTALALGILGMCLSGFSAQTVHHLSATYPGGMPAVPVMLPPAVQTNGVQVSWDGPAGYYQVFQKLLSPNSTWQAVGRPTNLSCSVTVSGVFSGALYKVSAPTPQYVGQKSCVLCHNAVCRYETNTAHANAFISPGFQSAHGQTNASCLPCHTVGYGVATGFATAVLTPQLAGVQCENCHGPAGNHASNPGDLSSVPRVEVAATLCGGCHSASHTSYTNAPTYEQWSAGPHSVVVPEALQAMTASVTNINTCGACHSGSARVAFLNGQTPSLTLSNDYNVAIACASCHDPHQTNSNPVQLLGALASTNNFHLTSADVASGNAFTNKLSASGGINLCAQCHNDLGAAWTDTAAAPHQSVQYNFLLGNIGELSGGSSAFDPGAHAGLPLQCVDCHMSTSNQVAGSHDHSLAPNYAVCARCHGSSATNASVATGWSSYLSNQVSLLVYNLNRWSATKAAPTLRTNGAVAWEYTAPGGLTWQTNNAGYVTGWALSNSVSFTGPNAAGQSLLTSNYPNILKARFNLYLYLKDGSAGVHNPIYAYLLLDAAETWVTQELSK